MAELDRGLEIDDFASSFGAGDREGLLRFPKFLMLETVSVCNARCVMCTINDWQRDFRVMRDDLFQRILSELAPEVGWVEKVTLNMNGEPLMDKKIFERIRALKQLGIRRIGFSSNASMLDAEKAQALLDSGLDEVIFSIDGARKESFEAIRVGLEFEECVANVERFLLLRDQQHKATKVQIRMIQQEANAEDVPAFLAHWSTRAGKQDRVSVQYAHNWGNRIVTLRAQKAKPVTELNDRPCHSLWSTFHIFCDGTVPMCCVDYNAETRVGSMADSTISELWRGEVLRRLRDAHLDRGRRSMSACLDCDIWTPTSRLESLAAE